MEEKKVSFSFRQIREMAETSGDAERVLKEMFPAAFEQEEYYFFGQSFAVTTYFLVGHPLTIGNGLAKKGHKLRVLLVDPEWEPQIVKDYDGDKTAILLKRVQKNKH
jgi:hypothetical protein